MLSLIEKIYKLIIALFGIKPEPGLLSDDVDVFRWVKISIGFIILSVLVFMSWRTIGLAIELVQLEIKYELLLFELNTCEEEVK